MHPRRHVIGQRQVEAVEAVEAGVETASGIAVFLAVAVEDPVAPARLEVVPAGTAAAAHAAVVHAAHPACELPAAPEAGGGGDEWNHA